MTNAVAIIGSGGHARSLITLAENCHVPLFALYDSSFDAGKEELICGYRLAGFPEQITDDRQILLAAGDNSYRQELFDRFTQQLYRGNLVHETAFVANRVTLGTANQIFGRVFINAETSLGQNNIINTGAIVEHEVRIGNHNHISVGTVLCGRVTLGDGCMIGAGSVIIDRISICDQVIIGANSTVTKSISEPGTYVGSPARRVK